MPQHVQTDDARSTSRVSARDGLRLRSGPGLEHAVLRVLPFGTALFVEREVNGWVAVDLEGDGAIDGFVSMAFVGA
ncbi:MAG: SH3 domain-containing protein [Pseudomonadota bacterium]